MVRGKEHFQAPAENPRLCRRHAAMSSASNGIATIILLSLLDSPTLKASYVASHPELAIAKSLDVLGAEGGEVPDHKPRSGDHFFELGCHGMSVLSCQPLKKALKTSC